MDRLPRIVAVLLLVGGVVMIIAGMTTYYLVQRELSDENIVVSDDAENFAGDDVDGPFTAYSEATVIKKHAADIADGLTYAQLERDDPRRESVMFASFLRASLFTSVVAFGVAVLVIGLGVLFILVGIALIAIDRRMARAADAEAGEAGSFDDAEAGEPGSVDDAEAGSGDGAEPATEAADAGTA